MFKNCITRLNRRIDFTKGISTHLCGPQHSKIHKRLVGGAILFIGVAVSKLASDVLILHIVFDGIGYALHGIGLIPFISAIEKIAEK